MELRRLPVIRALERAEIFRHQEPSKLQSALKGKAGKRESWKLKQGPKAPAD